MLPPTRYLVKVWKALTRELSPLEYSNQYVFEAPVELSSSALQNVCISVALAESKLHLTDVMFRRATIGYYAPEAPGQSAEYIHAVNLSAIGLQGVRLLDNPCPVNYALHAVKTTPRYRHGRNWYFGVLNESQVALGSGGRWKLTDVNTLQQIFDYWFHGYHLANLPCQLVVANRGIGVPDAERFQPAEFRASGLVIANARFRARKTKQGKGIAAFEATAAALDTVATSLEHIRYWQVIGTEFNPTSLKSHVEQAIAGASAAAKSVESMTTHAVGETDPEPITPVARWGVDQESMYFLACATKVKVKDWATTVLDIQPYEYLDGGTYYHYEDLEKFHDILTEVQEKVIELNDYDFFNNKLEKPLNTPCN